MTSPAVDHHPHRASPASDKDLGPPVLFPHASTNGVELARRLRAKNPLFVCVIASTDTALIPGISAAGASPELIPFTSAADAEVLAHGSARCIRGVPSNPLGPPGPALITLAALQLGEIPNLLVSAGCRMLPDAPFIALGDRPGGLISEGHAVQDAEGLFLRGQELGRRLAAEHDYLVIAESVPGGTTTALALMLALGLDADGRVSSSMAGNAHELKTTIARRALQHLDATTVEMDPLSAVETLGDPMQPAAAGLAAGALGSGTPVLLAGGTQMVAVLALLHRMASVGRSVRPDGRVAVATTRWVVEDATADTVGLMAQVGPEPLLATSLSFASSRHPRLRQYEDGLVKEGVGAGGAAVAAALKRSVSCEELLVRIETLYEGMLAAAERDL